MPLKKRKGSGGFYKKEDIEKPLKEISFLEKGNSLSSELIRSKVGAILLPNEEELIDIANAKNLAWASFDNPRLAAYVFCISILSPCSFS